MTDKELKELVASLAIAQQKNEVQFAEIDAKIAKVMAEVAEQQKKTDIQIKPETDIWAKELIEDFDEGDSAEEFFYRSLLDNAYLGDMHFDTIYRNLPSCKGKLQDEFDVVLV